MNSVLHARIYFTTENKSFCILGAINKDAVEKSNQELGNKCDWISEVKTIAGLEKTGRHFSN
jgi:hypothetical protein